MKKSLLILGFAVMLAFASCTTGNRKSLNTPFSNKEIQDMVDELYSKMTVEERAAQLYGIRPDSVMTDGKLSLEKCRRLIPYGIGHVCQYACALDIGPDELRDFVRDLQNYLMNETPSGIPAIFHEEAITGFTAKGATIYPQQLGVACTWNEELAKKKTRETAVEMRKAGATLALSPMVDVIRSAYWSRIEESYGEDSYLSAAMATAFIDGLQNDGDLRTGVAATTKHFLGYGGGNESDWKEIYEEIIFPHEVAIRQSGSKVVMTSYGKFKGEKAVASDMLITDLLHDYLEFDGCIVSDYESINPDNVASPEGRMVLGAEALMAGNDLDFPKGSCYKDLPEALEKGLITEERFEEAVKKALTLKARLGLFDKDMKFYEEGHLDFCSPESRKTAYELACQSVVLMKNDGILPLKPAARKIALVGPNANSYWAMMGDYTFPSMQFFWWDNNVDMSDYDLLTLKEALEERIGGDFTLGYERGCDWSLNNEITVEAVGDPRANGLDVSLMDSADPTDWGKAVKLASESDVVIVALGENPLLCGENRNRQGIRLPGEQEQFLKDMIATGKPVVLVMFGGRQQVIGELEDQCAAVLQAWFPGQEGGPAVADLLLGNVNPSGKLCVSYPYSEFPEQYCYNYGIRNEKIAHPFGFGLSYSTFEYSDIRVTPEAKTSSEEIEITCTIKNTSDIPGAEIVQLYLSPESGQDIKPIQLKGFARVELAPGERKTVVFKVSPQQLAYYDNGLWTIAPGSYSFKVGASSEDIRLAGQCLLKGGAKSMNHRDTYMSESSII